MYILNATYYTVAHALVDNNTPCYVQTINPGNKVLTIQKKSRLSTITKAYNSGIIAVIMPAVLTALAMAATVEPTLTPAPTQEHAGTLLISLLALAN